MRGVFAFLFVFVFIGAADAVQSCLSLETLTGCGYGLLEANGYVDWSVDCLEPPFRGIAGCSVYEDSYVRASADEDLAQEVYCFCKVYAPFESGWQYAINVGASCYAYCSSYCAEGFATGNIENPDFREKIMVPVK